MWNEWGELSRVKNELNKLSGLIVGSNVLQSPLDFWGRYDVWRETVKGLENAIREMEENDEDNFCPECGHRIKREDWPCMET